MHKHYSTYQSGINDLCAQFFDSFVCASENRHAYLDVIDYVWDSYFEVRDKKEIATRFLQWLLPYLTSIMPRVIVADGTEHSSVEILASSLKVITEPMKMEE